MLGSPVVAGKYGTRNFTKPQEGATNNFGKADLQQSCRGEDGGGSVDQWEWIIQCWAGGRRADTAAAGKPRESGPVKQNWLEERYK